MQDTLSNKIQLKNHLKAVNPTENDAKLTFQAPCCCFERRHAMDLLWFKTVNVSID